MLEIDPEKTKVTNGEDEEEPDCETCPNAMIVPVLGDDGYPVADAPECPFEECVYRRTDSL